MESEKLWYMAQDYLLFDSKNKMLKEAKLANRSTNCHSAQEIDWAARAEGVFQSAE